MLEINSNLNFISYKDKKSYKFLKILYIILLVISPLVILFYSYNASHYYIGITASSIYFPFFILSIFIFGFVYFVVLNLLKKILIDLFYNKKYKKPILLIILVLSLLFGASVYSSEIHHASYIIGGEEYKMRVYDGYTKNTTNTTTTPSFRLLDNEIMSGKPVIYLYPEKEMDVQVKVYPVGGLSKTMPDHGDGWFVRAGIDGVIYNYENSRNYPYLFWEGFGYKDDMRPKKGFVIKQEDLEFKMEELLAKAGLIEKEIDDFMEFWFPRMPSSPYVFLTFVPKEMQDKIAPLDITPQPDTVIRVFMDYFPLEDNIEIEEQKIETPERNGFTVVEWGGALY